uniref:STAS domain-containing protein n=2 Tax=Caenorhabditis tropicalis TaxID=1561998 RepID=A0A1I7TKH9_9PELO
MKGMMPITLWLPQYNWRSSLLLDFLGGLMVSVMSVPQSLAYGMLVGVPPSYGLITGIIGPFVYSLFGTSKHASPGSFAIVSLMVGSVVESFGDSSSTDGFSSNLTLLEDHFCCRQNKPKVSDMDAIAIATSVTLLAGLFQILFGLMNAGLLAVWLSDQLVQGLISGAAVHVLTSQLKSMTGISNVPPTSEPFQHVQFYICFFSQVQNVEIPALLMSVTCVSLLLVSAYIIDPYICKKVPVKFPMELLLVIGMTLIVHFTRNTSYEFEVKTVGEVESGIPSPYIPPMRNLFGMMGSAISIAIISFVIHISLCKLIAKKKQYVVSSNQEWFALGLMHSTSSFFGCFAGGSSLGRTMMQVKCGTKSQLSTIVSSIVLIIFVMGAAGTIKYLPKPVLASIVVVAMKDLFIQIFTCSALRNKNFVDYVSIRKRLGLYETAYDIPGIKVFRFDSPIYFANSELFVGRIHEACGLNPLIVRGEIAETEKKQKEEQKKREKQDAENQQTKEKETKLEVTAHQAKVLDEKHPEPDPDPTLKFETTQLTHIIVDCSAVLYVDLMGIDALIDVYNDYKTIDISVLFANTQERVRQIFETTNFFEEVPRNRVFVSVSDAVDQAELEQKRKNEAYFIQLKAAPKPTVAPPVAKSVGQKSAPLGDNTLIPAQSSASLATGVEFSIKEKTAREGTTQKKTRVPSKSNIHWDDLDKTQ